MKKERPGPPGANDLRKRAEERLRKTPSRAESAGAEGGGLSDLVHDLQIGRVELEMQNEELRRVHEETAVLLEKYQDLYDFAPVGYFTLDHNGVIRQANLAGAYMLGRPRGELVGRRLAGFLTPGSRPSFDAFLAGLMAGDHGISCEATFPREGVDALHVHLGGVAFASVSECRVAMVDVTEHRKADEELARQRERLDQANQQLRESERMFRAVFDGNAAAMAIMNTDTTIAMVNDAYTKMSGYASEEVVGTSWTREIPPGDLERMKEYNRRRLANQGDAPTSYEFSFYAKDGTVKSSIMSVCFVPELGKIVTSFFDITERKKDEEALRDARGRLESVIEGGRVGTWEWNLQTGEGAVNEVWAQLVGYSMDELGPVNAAMWRSLVHPADLEVANGLLERHFAGEFPYYETDCRMKHKEGRWVWVHDRGQVITRTADGRPLMMFGTQTDINERMLAEEALRESEARFKQLTLDRFVQDRRTARSVRGGGGDDEGEGEGKGKGKGEGEG